MEANCNTRSCYTLLLSPPVVLRPHTHSKGIFWPSHWRKLWLEAVCFQVVRQSVCPSHSGECEISGTP